MADPSSIAEALGAVRAEIARAERLSGRAPGSVTLTCVCKTQPPEAIEAALGAGQRVFGDNRVQEAETRWSDRRPGSPGLELRLIGPLQSNKARAAVRLFDVIETLDRPSLARALADAVQAEARAPTLFVQVNTGEEAQKAGVAPREADAFIASLRRDHDLHPVGLMCIPPIEEEPAMHFALLRRIAERNGLNQLSMGMSADYLTAIRFGATHVRIGSAVFGARPAADG